MQTFFLPCYLIELYETINFILFNLNVSMQITSYMKPKKNPTTSLKDDCFVPFSP